MDSPVFGIEDLPIRRGDDAIAVLEFHEHQELRISLPEPLHDNVEVLSRLFAPARQRGLVAWRVEITAAGAQAVFASSSVVGFASCWDDDGRELFVRVTPKITSIRLFELLVAAGLLPRWHPAPDVHLAPAADTAVVEWTLRAFLEALQAFTARRGIRALHERVSGTLPNRLRGRLNVSGFVKNLMQGHPDRIPANYPSLEVDHVINRRLLWAIHIGTHAAARLKGTEDLVAGFNAVRRKFGGVSLVPLRHRERSMRPIPSRNLRHYDDVLDLAQFVIEQLSVDTSPGNRPAVSVAIDMNTVFQRAFIRGLRRFAPNARDDMDWDVRFRITAGLNPNETAFTTTMHLDVFVPATSAMAPIVLDTKWKTKKGLARQPSDERFYQSELRVRPEDHYQIISYATELLHRNMAGPTATCVAALLYPVLGDVRDAERVVNIGESEIRLRAMAWNLELPFNESLRDVWDRLCEYARLDGDYKQLTSPSARGRSQTM